MSASPQSRSNPSAVIVCGSLASAYRSKSRSAELKVPPDALFFDFLGPLLLPVSASSPVPSSLRFDLLEKHHEQNGIRKQADQVGQKKDAEPETSRASRLTAQHGRRSTTMKSRKKKVRPKSAGATDSTWLPRVLLEKRRSAPEHNSLPIRTHFALDAEVSGPLTFLLVFFA